MKQLFFTWMLFTLTWVSCNKDDAEQPEPFEIELLVASWKMTARQIVSGKDQTVLESYEVEGCDAMQEFIFNNDGTFTFTDYKKQKGECVRREERDEVGSYRYDEDTKKITLIFDNEYEDTDVYEIVVLTSSEMRLLVISGDYDDDGTADNYVVVFNK